MPTSYDIDQHSRLVRSSGSGILTEQESWDHYARLNEDPAFDPSYRQLCDLRDVDELQASTPFLRQLAEKSVFAPHSKRAFVAPKALHYGLARMLQVFAEIEGSEIGVFHTIAEAEAWLGLDDSSAAEPAS